MKNKVMISTPMYGGKIHVASWLRGSGYATQGIMSLVD